MSKISDEDLEKIIGEINRYKKRCNNLNFAIESLREEVRATEIDNECLEKELKKTREKTKTK